MTTESIQTDIATSQEREAQARVPQSGIFNEVTIPVVSSGTFGTVGYFIGKWIGRMGDDNRHPAQSGRFEGWMKWIGASSMALLAAAVSIRQTREAKEQALALAKRSVELERHNEALSSMVTKPVGTLIDTFEKTPETAVPDTQVSEAKPAGMMAESTERGIA